MNFSYVIGITLALVVLVGGVVLIGRDGTELPEVDNLATPAELPSRELELIPIVEPESTTTEEELELESEADDDASMEDVEELPEATEEEPEEVIPEPEVSSDGAIIVSYTDAGFTPKTVIIDAGDTVRFENDSSRDMWVASAIHPTHNEYPVEADTDCSGSSFDACVGIPPGQTWGFTFDEIGEWGYHDHLSPTRTGNVVVE